MDICITLMLTWRFSSSLILVHCFWLVPFRSRLKWLRFWLRRSQLLWFAIFSASKPLSVSSKRLSVSYRSNRKKTLVFALIILFVLTYLYLGFEVINFLVESVESRCCLRFLLGHLGLQVIDFSVEFLIIYLKKGKLDVWSWFLNL